MDLTAREVRFRDRLTLWGAKDDHLRNLQTPLGSTRCNKNSWYNLHHINPLTQPLMSDKHDNSSGHDGYLMDILYFEKRTVDVV